MLICGYIGFENAGDEAILDRMVRYSRANLTVMSKEPHRTRDLHGVPAVNRYSPCSVASAMKKSDLLILGGGTLLQSISSRRSLFYYTAVAMLATLMRLPFVIYGGVEDSGILTRYVCGHARALVLRDRHSYDICRALAPSALCIISPDPALLSSKSYRTLTSKRDFIVCTPKKGEDAACKYALLFAKKTDKKILFLAMHPEDNGICREYARMSKSVFVKNTDFDIIEDVIKRAYALVSSRLHGIIFAYSAGIPFAALTNGNDKIYYFIEDCKRENALEIYNRNQGRKNGGIIICRASKRGASSLVGDITSSYNLIFGADGFHGR